MVSTKLLVCCAFLALVALVESTPCHKKFHPKHCPKPKPCHCPDEWINRYFIEIDCTIRCDFEWIGYLIERISPRSDCAEYGPIIDLYGRFDAARLEFDNCYGPLREDIFGRVTRYRGKYSPLSICYTERLVCLRKRARHSIFPYLCKYRSLYFQILPLITDFCNKYNIDYQPRPLALPRGPDYNFISYFPNSPHSSSLSNIYQTCFNDYRYLCDWVNKWDCPENHPLYGPRRQIIDDINNCWIDFNNDRRLIDIKYYPRFVDCWDNQDQVDIIYIEIIECFRPYQLKFGYRWYDIYCRIQDLCNENKFPIIDYVDWDKWTPQTNCRGSYIPSPMLSDYFNRILVTCRMDYWTALRLWRELECKEGSPEWNRRREIIDEMRRRLCELERYINRCIRRVLDRFNKDYINCLPDWDNKYRPVIDEIIIDCNKDLWPLLLCFREQYYVNDDCLLPIFNQRGINDFSRNIIPCQTPCYDISVYMCDNDIRDLIRWFENCLRTNYYLPVQDLINVDFPEGSEEYNLRRKCLKDLECIWMDYRRDLHELYRKLIDLLCRRRIAIGCDDYNREIKCLIEWIRPRFIKIIDRFRCGCKEIDVIIGRLYEKNTSCRRHYSYIEASFEINISGSVRSC